MSIPCPHLIAIVDDDPSLLRALHRLVQSNGYTVYGQALLHAIRRAGGPDDR